MVVRVEVRADCLVLLIISRAVTRSERQPQCQRTKQSTLNGTNLMQKLEINRASWYVVFLWYQYQFDMFERGCAWFIDQI